MAIKLITITNRENKTYEVSDRKPLLQELRAQGLDLPYGCEYGGCITCAAKLIDGEVDQRSQVALNNRQINNGYVVLCVARAKTDCKIEIGVETSSSPIPGQNDNEEEVNITVEIVTFKAIATN